MVWKNRLIYGEAMMKLLDLVIVDDEPKIRNGLSKLLSSRPGFEITGVFENAMEALEQLSVSYADVIITDIKMPEINGLDLINRIREKDENTKIIILSGYSDFSFIREEKDFPEAFRRMIGQQREVYGETFVLSDAFDHQDIPAEAPAVLQRIRELCPGSEVLWTDFTDLEEWKHPEELPVVRGEQIHTCKGIRAYGIQIPYCLLYTSDAADE